MELGLVLSHAYQDALIGSPSEGAGASNETLSRSDRASRKARTVLERSDLRPRQLNAPPEPVVSTTMRTNATEISPRGADHLVLDHLSAKPNHLPDLNFGELLGDRNIASASLCGQDQNLWKFQSAQSMSHLSRLR